MSGRSGNLTTLFLGRLIPPKQLTSTKCTYFLQTTILLESAEREIKVTDWVLNPGPVAFESEPLLTVPCSLEGYTPV